MSSRSDRAEALRALRSRFDSLTDHRLVLFGGKGGVGKTTLSLLAALHLAPKRPVVLVTTDPAGNLEDFEGDLPAGLEIETVDAPALWKQFLDENIESLLELGDRGTYLDRDELRNFFELSIPGVDEIMGWTRISEIVAETPDALVIVDTAPTGHTLRLLGSAAHWRAMEVVLDSMQEKHREIVAQLTRREARDHLDDFLDAFDEKVSTSERLFSDSSRTAFIPVTIAEPWGTDQTARLIEEVGKHSIDVPFAVLNHASVDCNCDRCRRRREAEADAGERIPVDLVRAPRACSLLGAIADMERYLRGNLPAKAHRESKATRQTSSSAALEGMRLIFVVGKGGVGKTSVATSLSLQSSSRGESTVLLSIDPAHSVDDVFSRFDPPEHLRVETIDTRASWQKLERQMGQSLSHAISGLTPKGFTNVHDETIMSQLLKISPPGADEIFALIRILELWEDDTTTRIIVDTAPTGHFLRLLDLPELAGAWVRQLMRIALNYKDVFAGTSLGQKLLNASRSLREFREMLADPACAAVPVTRAEPIVLRETIRLLEALRSHHLHIPLVAVNNLTPDDDCSCDERVRAAEIEELSRLDSHPLVLIDRRDEPPITRDALEKLLGMMNDERAVPPSPPGRGSTRAKRVRGEGSSNR